MQVNMKASYIWVGTKSSICSKQIHVGKSSLTIHANPQLPPCSPARDKAGKVSLKAVGYTFRHSNHTCLCNIIEIHWNTIYLTFWIYYWNDENTVRHTGTYIGIPITSAAETAWIGCIWGTGPQVTSRVSESGGLTSNSRPWARGTTPHVTYEYIDWWSPPVITVHSHPQIFSNNLYISDISSNVLSNPGCLWWQEASFCATVSGQDA